MNALIRFFYKINPEEITPDRFAKLQEEIMWLIEMELIELKVR